MDVSRKKIAAEVELEMEGLDVSAERKKEIVERRLRNEINRGVQTIQYQVVTLMTTNGQAPFITVFMYLGEARNPQEKADLAIIIEETIRQRYQGVKNEAGVWITPAFPKLIYVLEEDNIRPGTPYYYLTELAAKCTAKRMVPDYISEKKMLELKVDKNGEGHCYTCMGCRSFLTPYVSGPVPPRTAGTAQAAAGHSQRCRSHSVAVWCTGSPEKGRKDRQAAVRRLLHHQSGLCRSV